MQDDQCYLINPITNFIILTDKDTNFKPYLKYITLKKL